MIVTVGNTKGGVGKTTVAFNIAVARALAGRDVWLIDGDRQATAQSTVSIRTENEIQPGIACATYPDGPTLRGQLRQMADKFDDVIIDTGGWDSSALRVAMVLSDVLLVPFRPRNYEVWALGDIAELVTEAQSIREDLRAFAVLNCADPGKNAKDNEEAAAAVAKFPPLEFLPAVLRQRKVYSNAAGEGQSVLEYKPADKKAAEELQALVSLVFNI